MLQKAFFFHKLATFRSAKKRRKDTFFPHTKWWHLYCFAILGSTSIVIHSEKQRQLRNRPGSDSATSRDFLRKTTKGIHSCKPASLNRPKLGRSPRVSRFGLAVRLVSRGTSVRIRFGSPFSLKVVVCGHCLVTLSLTIMKN